MGKRPFDTAKLVTVLLAVWVIASLITVVLTMPKTDPDYRERFPSLAAEAGVQSGSSDSGECPHSYWTEDNVCAECGLECTHRSWLGGRCLQCGAECPHEERDESGRCSVCGCLCRHPSYTDGICDDCGEHCVHRFTNSICEICGFECPHEEVEDGYCTACLADISAIQENSATPAA